MRDFRPIVIVLTVAALLGAALTAPAAPALSSGGAKKICKTVTRRVHGKKTRVKVCHTVKTPPKPPTPTQTPLALPSAHVLASIPVTGPGAMSFAFGSVWVNRSFDGQTHTVTRIDPSANQVSTVSVPNGVTGGTGMTDGFGSIWEADFPDGSVTRIDPQTNTVTTSITTPGKELAGVAAAAGAVWVAAINADGPAGGNGVFKIDPATNEVVDRIAIGNQTGGPYWLVSAAGSIWTFDPTRGEIVRIDPTSDTALAITGGSRAVQTQFAGDDTHLWFSSLSSVATQQELDRIDPATNTVSTAIPGRTLAGFGVRRIDDLELGGGSLFLLGSTLGADRTTLLRINPESGAVQDAWSVPAVSDTGVYGAGSYWVNNRTIGANGVLRLDVGS